MRGHTRPMGKGNVAGPTTGSVRAWYTLLLKMPVLTSPTCAQQQRLVAAGPLRLPREAYCPDAHQ